MREDIYGGLKNALERGADLEDAVRSFINAGYPESEVRGVAQGMSSAPQHAANNPGMKMHTQTKQFMDSDVSQQYTPRKSGIDWKLMVLSSILFLLIAVLIVSFFFKEQIINSFSGLF